MPSGISKLPARFVYVFADSNQKIQKDGVNELDVGKIENELLVLILLYYLFENLFEFSDLFFIRYYLLYKCNSSRIFSVLNRHRLSGAF